MEQPLCTSRPRLEASKNANMACCSVIAPQQAMFIQKIYCLSVETWFSPSV